MKALKNIVIGTSLTEQSDGVVRTGLAMNTQNSRIDTVLIGTSLGEVSDQVVREAAAGTGA